MIPSKWKRFIYHVGRARDQYSMAKIGLVAGGKRKEGSETIFFTPLDHLLCLFKNSHFSSTEIQEKNESQHNQDLWWILLSGRRRSHRLQLQWARGRNISEVKIHGNQLLEKIDQGDLMKAQIFWSLISTSMSNSWKASLQQVIQNWMLTVLGLLKSGKLRLRRTIDQGNLIKLLGEWCNKFDLITKQLFSTEPRNP